MMAMNQSLNENADKKRRWRKTFLSLVLGGVVGFAGAFLFLRLAHSGAVGELDGSRTIAALEALVYIITALAIVAGLLSPKAGSKFLNVEDADELREQSAMLGYSAISMAVAGGALMVAALAAPDGPIPEGVALALFAALMIVAVITSMASRKRQDELMLQVSSEGGSIAFYLLFLIGGSWTLLAHLGFASAPAALDWLSLFWAVALLGAFIAVGKRGMLLMR